MTGPLFPVFLGIFCAMALLIAAYLLRRASRGFDPPRRPETRAERLADPAPTLDERMAASIAALDHSDVLAIVCPPCNGQPGRCTCAGLCGHPACVGDHTVLHDMARELEAMLAADSDKPGRPE